MSQFICPRCQSTLLFRRALRPRNAHLKPMKRAYTTSSSPQQENPLDPSRDAAQTTPKPHHPAPRTKLDIQALLSKPTWSIRSLLPSSPPAEEITPKQLHHLLRLSALPLPATSEEEKSLLDTLHRQLHFVRDIQGVDTEGVEPLQSIRDETEQGVRERTVRLEDLRGVLGREVFVGRNRRPRRGREVVEKGAGEEEVFAWDPLSTAGEVVDVKGSGRFFVVRSGKGGSGDKGGRIGLWSSGSHYECLVLCSDGEVTVGALYKAYLDLRII